MALHHSLQKPLAHSDKLSIPYPKERAGYVHLFSNCSEWIRSDDQSENGFPQRNATDQKS